MEAVVGVRRGQFLAHPLPPVSNEVDEQFIADAKLQGFNWSYLNLDEYSGYDEERIKEALDDWGSYECDRE